MSTLYKWRWIFVIWSKWLKQTTTGSEEYETQVRTSKSNKGQSIIQQVSAINCHK